MPPSISPQRLMAAISAAQQVKELLPYDDDNKLLIDTVDGETEVFTLLDRLAEAAIADKELAERAAERAKRIAARAERSRDVIARMLEALDLNKVERPLFTASISHVRKPIVTDPALLPEAFMRHAPDMILIGKALRAGNTVDGAELGNDRPVLTIRTA